MQRSTKRAPRMLAPPLRRFMRRPSQAPRPGCHRISLPAGSLARGTGSAFGCLDRARANVPRMSPSTPATIPATPSVRAMLAAALASADSAAIAAQIRSLAADLMYASGYTRDEIDERLDF